MMDAEQIERFNLLQIETKQRVEDGEQSAGIQFYKNPQEAVDHSGFVGVLELRGDGKVPHLASDIDMKGWRVEALNSPYDFMIEMDAGSWVKCNGRFRISVKLNPDYLPSPTIFGTPEGE
ncbi:hypothetical protein [Sphingobium sp. EP60837]|uniref:hypothetical protein n=1 Tax=Sphingobium sp. EP60837 TaxID=1855519 RepID=UPI0007DD8DC0|nr:hypothetical protein [Sphingobium sp. EP60837]ANI79021.1 hypothetical protein EP837_02626 [Sphingobium sp. EP60837]